MSALLRVALRAHLPADNHAEVR